MFDGLDFCVLQNSTRGFPNKFRIYENRNDERGLRGFVKYAISRYTFEVIFRENSAL